MSFGDNSNGLCPMMMMMMPLLTNSSSSSSSHQYHQTHAHPDLIPNPNPNPNPNLNTIFSSPSNNNNNNNNNTTSNINQQPNPNLGGGGGGGGVGYYFMDNNNIKAKIMGHPLYHRLLASYANCQKVGAPAEVVSKLEEAGGSLMGGGVGGEGSSGGDATAARRYEVGQDPGLDQFMEAYCEMLTKYEQELSKPFKEAMLFLQRAESQFKSLTVSSPSSDDDDRVPLQMMIGYPLQSQQIACCDTNDTNGSSEEEVDVNNNFIDPQAEDKELKGQLLRRYSGYIGSLKQEFMKKRKKGKLPKEARQQLLDWWTRHYKWPYPSESQKLALAEATGLDQKQINNWFINQRKRHWKPSEDMQYMVMDATHSHYYMDHNVMGNPFPMDISPSLL